MSQGSSSECTDKGSERQVVNPNTACQAIQATMAFQVTQSKQCPGEAPEAAIDRFFIASPYLTRLT